ncbi:MAG: hypothetical protein KDD25_02855 [Bdellovibrionales bacterium]|nr:hypothetical protein [Bdellovibrionales bacterium]
MKRASRFLMSVMFVLTVSSTGWAQDKEAEKETRALGPRRQLATIIFAGLGGAVLGLSTLSFYDRPQDKLANIAIGLAIGLISGTIYVTVKTVSQPADYYGEKEAMNRFHSGELYSFQDRRKDILIDNNSITPLQYSFEF